MPEKIIIDRDAVVDIMEAYGWTAEWEPGQQDEDEGPVRFVYGNTGSGYRRSDPILTLHWGEMALSGHPTLSLSVRGVAGEIAAVDLVTTPIAELPATVAHHATRNLADFVEHGARALSEAVRLSSEPIVKHMPTSVES